jgi:hypothetical protein
LRHNCCGRELKSGNECSEDQTPGAHHSFVRIQQSSLLKLLRLGWDGLRDGLVLKYFHDRVNQMVVRPQSRPFPFQNVDRTLHCVISTLASCPFSLRTC